MASRRFSPLAVCGAVVVLFLTSSLVGRPQGSLRSDVAEYLAVISAYREGRPEDAVASLRARDRARLDRTIRDLPTMIAGSLVTCREGADTVPFGTVDAAILAHTEAALLDMRARAGDDAARHLGHARRLLSWASRSFDSRRRFLAGESRACGEPAPLVERDWLQATARLALGEWALETATRLSDELVNEFPDDVDASLVAGTVQEALAINDAQLHPPPAVWSQSDSDYRRFQAAYQRSLRDQQRLRERAIRFYERALAGAPARHDIRVRLGWALACLGREADARAALDIAASAATSPRDRYLGTLLLGRVHERAGDRSQAIAWYEKASSVLPGSHVAHLALAHALGADGRLAAGRLELERAVDQSHAASDDPWTEYPHGDWRAGQAQLERMRAAVTWR